MAEEIKIELIHIIGRIIAGSIVLAIGKYVLQVWGG